MVEAARETIAVADEALGALPGGFARHKLEAALGAAWLRVEPEAGLERLAGEPADVRVLALTYAASAGRAATPVLREATRLALGGRRCTPRELALGVWAGLDEARRGMAGLAPFPRALGLLAEIELRARPAPELLAKADALVSGTAPGGEADPADGAETCWRALAAAPVAPETRTDAAERLPRARDRLAAAFRIACEVPDAPPELEARWAEAAEATLESDPDADGRIDPALAWRVGVLARSRPGEARDWLRRAGAALGALRDPEGLAAFYADLLEAAALVHLDAWREVFARHAIDRVLRRRERERAFVPVRALRGLGRLPAGVDSAMSAVMDHLRHVTVPEAQLRTVAGLASLAAVTGARRHEPLIDDLGRRLLPLANTAAEAHWLTPTFVPLGEVDGRDPALPGLAVARRLPDPTHRVLACLGLLEGLAVAAG